MAFTAVSRSFVVCVEVEIWGAAHFSGMFLWIVPLEHDALTGTPVLHVLLLLHSAFNRIRALFLRLTQPVIR